MTIPATHAEVEQIYLNAELNQCRSICLTSCHSSEGVTALTMALTERYLLAGYHTALVDLNMFHPSFVTAELGNTQPSLLQHNHSLRCFTGITVPKDTSEHLLYKRPDFLQKAMQTWLGQYERVVVDTSPLLNVNRNNIPAQCIASACDGVILVVMAGHTSTLQVQAAMDLLKQSNISLLGTILNCRDKPTLASEICREINRIPLLPERWRERIKERVMNNEYLNATT
ncbi:AAA family ATPase [Vibrio fluvialis]|uniref:AAA family ATPase n=1 Tax=Vibrio fluvialis TaxID=676 RepID=UPI001EECB0BF|nr:AAA family ATPase [Vibrio fluvialis]MCG6390488.1 AAA family ATPase [Vibrio fluvialis]MCG6418140.1 AAA family ATPase [Vibrio fluvialis]